MQYERNTSSVQMRMCSKSKAHDLYERGCAVHARHIISTKKGMHIISMNEDVQYKQGISSSFGTRGQ